MRNGCSMGALRLTILSETGGWLPCEAKGFYPTEETSTALALAQVLVVNERSFRVT